MKNLLIRLQLFIDSPFFISFLTFIYFTVYKIYFGTVLLCDDTDISLLYELKNKLTVEVANYRIASVKVEEYSDLQEQLKEISTPRYRNFNMEELYNKKIDS